MFHFESWRWPILQMKESQFLKRNRFIQFTKSWVYLLVRPPARVEGLDEPLVLLVEVHAELRGLAQQLQAHLAVLVRRGKLKRINKT